MSTILIAVRLSEAASLLSGIQENNNEVLAFSKLEEVLSSLNKLQFDAAVIDDNFDGAGTGWELAENIRHSFGSHPVIIIIDTSRNTNTYSHLTKLEGQIDWIMSTPFSAEELLTKINFRLLKRKQ
jgi:DNA-binding response OmpR family regulator